MIPWQTFWKNWLVVIAATKELSRFFLRAVAAFYISTLAELLKENKFKDPTAGYLEEFLNFVYGGWKNVLESD